MKVKKIFSIFLILILSLNYRYTNCYSLSQKNIFKEVLSEVSTEETFTYLCVNWSENFISDIKAYEEDIKTSFRREGIDINNYTYKEDEYNLKAATLNITKNKKSYVFSIKIKIRGYKEDDIKEFIQKIHKSLNLKESNLRISINIKTKLSNAEKIDLAKIKVEEYLHKKDYYADTVKFHNGYSAKVSAKDREDFQYLLCSYDTGDYLIIGDSEIFISY